MTINEKYEKAFYEYIYQKLELHKIEEILENAKVKKIKEFVKLNLISEYFVLINEGNFDNFTQDEVDSFNSMTDKDEITKFVSENYKRYFFHADKFEYIYFGPHTWEYQVPNDAIVMGMYYSVLGDGTDEEAYGIMCNQANLIQDKLGPDNGFKIAVNLYNEMVLSRDWI